jgi:NAD(P)H-flavin reductase/hemoglobin-like flavoprotein
LDTGRLKESFARVAAHGDEAALFFYSDLFLRHPQTRDLFPVSMAAQRVRLLSALGRIVSEVDRVDELAAFLQKLGRDHRKFGAQPEHFEPVGNSLLATLAHFSGEHWTEELAADWKAAYDLVAGVMTEAAAQDAEHAPPFWNATVVAHEVRAFDTAVLRVSPEQPLHYQPGQSVAVESELRPRIWRQYAIANAPREDGTLDFHVRMVDGGALSNALVRDVGVGSRLRLGPAVGALTRDPGSGRDVLLVAGSTGLAPAKALVEDAARLDDPPRVHLFCGARRAEGLYDVADLEKVGARAPWLTVTLCVSADGDVPDFACERGELPDVVARSGDWGTHEAYIAGSTELVGATGKRLAELGMPDEQIHVEDFGWSEPWP